MFEFKLQVCNLALVLFFEFQYIVATAQDKKAKRNPFFDAMMVAAPLGIIFDGLTAWTVNHRDIVPDGVNLALHGLFYESMVIILVILFLYMVSRTVRVGKKELFLCSLPGAVAVILILVFLPKVYYVSGKTTDYSMGISVYICYIALMVHFVMILMLIGFKHKTVERYKRSSMITILASLFVVTVAQCLMPEILTSSLLPVIGVAGMYIYFENPAINKLKKYNNEVISGFATLVESRDDNTGGHIKRTQLFVGVILDAMAKSGKYNDILSKDYSGNVYTAAPMHDIGKISTPDAILRKPGKLTAEEFEVMKQHASQGSEIIKELFADLDEPEFLAIASDVARYHHEKWNGKGYPDGLKGNEIPLHARIMAIADVFDAVSAKRCYRDALPLEECFEIIKEGRGTDFDPDLVDMFLESRSEIEQFISCD